MNPLVERGVSNWRTTLAGIIAAAGTIFTAIQQTNPGLKWAGTVSGILAGLTGIFAKDK